MLLILILIQHLLSVTRQYQHTHAVLDEAVELQWVFDVIRARVRHAGFTPCMGLNHLERIDTRDSSNGLSALEVQSGEIPKLLIQKMDETQFGLAEILTPTTLRVRAHFLKLNQPVMIADCKHAEVHSMQQTGDILTLNQPLVFDYAPEVYVGAWVSEAFFFKQHRGLFFQQHRVDYMAKADSIRFNLTQSKVIMTLISKLGKQYILEARMRM